MYISEKEMNRQADAVFQEHAGKLQFQNSKFLNVLTYFSTVAQALQKAPVFITMFGNFILFLFAVIIIAGIVLPCVSGVYRLSLWEFGNISFALFVLVMLSIVKRAIGLTDYDAERCTSSFCEDDTASILPLPKDPHADYYDEKRRLYMMHVKAPNSAASDSQAEQPIQIAGDEPDEGESFQF